MKVEYLEDLIIEIDKMIKKKEEKIKTLDQSVTKDPIQKQLIIIQKSSINASIENLQYHKINYADILNDDLLRRCCGCKVCHFFKF